ncbi:hypothetical protein L596_023315 [Steinernema carpocapsae]|uniref:UPAR/Ly6 domain-containing protein n=1 Tax=Steinernema carpocapsae TaxID=34508 RepID=A0A4U5ME25_STECR|nr:hypothetical protein L596_023315 [Steinernema carpocapsae]
MGSTLFSVCLLTFFLLATTVESKKCRKFATAPGALGDYFKQQNYPSSEQQEECPSKHDYCIKVFDKKHDPNTVIKGCSTTLSGKFSPSLGCSSTKCHSAQPFSFGSTTEKYNLQYCCCKDSQCNGVQGFVLSYVALMLGVVYLF